MWYSRSWIKSSIAPILVPACDSCSAWAREIGGSHRKLLNSLRPLVSPFLLFSKHSAPVPFHSLGRLLAGCPCEGQVYSAWLCPGHSRLLGVRAHIRTAAWVNWAILGCTVQALPSLLPSYSEADRPRQIQLCDANFLFRMLVPKQGCFQSGWTSWSSRPWSGSLMLLGPEDRPSTREPSSLLDPVSASVCLMDASPPKSSACALSYHRG